MCRTSPLQIETNFCDRHSVVAGVIRSAAYRAITPAEVLADPDLVGLDRVAPVGPSADVTRGGRSHGSEPTGRGYGATRPLATNAAWVSGMSVAHSCS